MAATKGVEKGEDIGANFWSFARAIWVEMDL